MRFSSPRQAWLMDVQGAVTRQSGNSDQLTRFEVLNDIETVFAAFLNTTPSTVMQWESGKKRPDGMGLKLLHIAKSKGLEGLSVG